MYDENAQDEATITVIATDWSHGVNTPVAKSDDEFKTPFKRKDDWQWRYAQPAAQTAAAAQLT